MTLINGKLKSKIYHIYNIYGKLILSGVIDDGNNYVKAESLI